MLVVEASCELLPGASTDSRITTEQSGLLQGGNAPIHMMLENDLNHMLWSLQSSELKPPESLFEFLQRINTKMQWRSSFGTVIAQYISRIIFFPLHLLPTIN